MAKSESFSSLPDEMVVNCLARISKSEYRSLSSVSKSFHSLLSSPEMYVARIQTGNTEPCLYVCLGLNQTDRRWFTLTIPTGGGKLRLERVKFPSLYCSARLNASSVAVGSQIYQMGGSNKGTRSRAVRVLDCPSHTWHLAPNMMVQRKRAKSCFLDGKIYVVGGCRKTEETMNWGEVFDLKTQTWKPFPSPSDSDNQVLKVLVLGEKLYVMTQHTMYAYDPKEEKWQEEGGRLLQELVGHHLKFDGPWCTIGNTVFISDQCEPGEYRYYDTRTGMWFMIQGLSSSVYMKQDYTSPTLELVNYGGKLVSLWSEWILDVVGTRTDHKRIWCAVIRLEERTPVKRLGPMIWGQVERMNVLLPKVHKSYQLLTSLSVSF